MPFCSVRCDYCAFYTIAGASEKVKADYMVGLLEEIESIAKYTSDMRSIFLGGGTPSNFTENELTSLMNCLHKHLRIPKTCEFTLEANPQTITKEKLNILKSGGVNRYSLGVQTFHEHLRQKIGRIGKVDWVERSLAFFEENKLKNFNCDLIFAIPGQTMEEWQYDLERIISYAPKHISCYSLMIEEGTPLYKSGMQEGDPELSANMWLKAVELLEKQGYKHYEVSNFAKPGYECIHNRDIWYGHPFLGVGPAAHFFDGINRLANPADIQKWLQKAPYEIDEISKNARYKEIFMSGLRVKEGWDWGQFHKKFDPTFKERHLKVLNQLQADGLLKNTNESIFLTQEGMLMSNYVFREIL
ncbi:MAG: radical SAM family heme chaperone HemW [Lentisphaeria bacterium]|nr:radical SAM family heme chaperone HemW [Lentisphaeria bacterium]